MCVEPPGAGRVHLAVDGPFPGGVYRAAVRTSNQQFLEALGDVLDEMNEDLAELRIKVSLFLVGCEAEEEACDYYA